MSAPAGRSPCWVVDSLPRLDTPDNGRNQLPIGVQLEAVPSGSGAFV
jgi:hypothetical protein